MNDSKINQASKFSNGNIMVKSRQNFPNGGVPKKSKIPPVREGGSQILGTVPNLYLVFNYDGFHNCFPFLGVRLDKTSGYIKMFLKRPKNKC